MNKELKDFIGAPVLWEDPNSLLFEKVHDRDKFNKDEVSLERDGITGLLFKKLITDTIMKNINGPAKEVYNKHGPFKYR